MDAGGLGWLDGRRTGHTVSEIIWIVKLVMLVLLLTELVSM